MGLLASLASSAPVAANAASIIGGLIRCCLKHEFLVVLAVAAIGAVGYYAIMKTRVDAIPDIGEKQVIVFADWPGPSPQNVDRGRIILWEDHPVRRAQTRFALGCYLSGFHTCESAGAHPRTATAIALELGIASVEDVVSAARSLVEVGIYG